MKKYIPFSILLLSFAVFFAAKSQAQSEEQNLKTFESQFQKGLQLSHQKKEAEALAAFKEALDFRPNDVATLTNLGLLSYSQGQIGASLAYLRKAQFLKPSFFQTRQIFSYIQSKTRIPGSEEPKGLYEEFRLAVLNFLSIDLLLLGLAIFAFGFGWTTLGYIKQRKISYEGDLALPSISWQQIIMTLGFVICASLSGLKYFDSQISRATITAAAGLSTAPSAESAQITNLLEGLEVIVLRSENEWVQISTPAGPTGWFPKKNLFFYR